MKKPIIALIYGGNSLEAEISIKSGKNVAKCLNREKYTIYEVLLRGESWRVLNPDGEEINDNRAEQLLSAEEKIEKGYAESQDNQMNANNQGASGRIRIADIQDLGGVEIDKTDFSFTYKNQKHSFDYAFIMIHGNPGENGVLQGYLEMMDIPFNTCSSFVSTITFDKHSCKRFLDFSGVKLAKDVFLRKNDFTEAECANIIEKLGLPVFVKPTDGGSSFGVTKVKKADELLNAINMAFEVSASVLVEECITGRELTNGIFTKGGKIVYLPVTEIVTEREFFDYEAKYLGESKEICPAPIDESLTKEIQHTSEKIYRYLGCKGLVRMDYILKGNDIYFLEMNTVPGMTAMSLVPAQVKVAGIPMQDFFQTLVEEDFK